MSVNCSSPTVCTDGVLCCFRKYRWCGEVVTTDTLTSNRFFLLGRFSSFDFPG